MLPRRSWKCRPLRSAFCKVSRQRWSKSTDSYGFPLRVRILAAVRGCGSSSAFSERDGLDMAWPMRRFIWRAVAACQRWQCCTSPVTDSVSPVSMFTSAYWCGSICRADGPVSIPISWTRRIASGQARSAHSPRDGAGSRRRPERHGAASAAPYPTGSAIAHHVGPAQIEPRQIFAQPIGVVGRGALAARCGEQGAAGVGQGAAGPACRDDMRQLDSIERV